jgi:hypothetical protein
MNTWMTIKGVERMEQEDWVRVTMKKGPHVGKQGYILKFDKAYDGFGQYRVKVRLTSDTKGNPFVPHDGMFYDHEIEPLPNLEIKREDLINLSLDIESEALFRLLTAEG